MMGSISTAIIALAAMLAIPAFGEGTNAAMTDQTISLPKTFEAWTRPESARIVDSSNIFRYMNGAGELYLAYGFDHLEVYEYTAEQEGSILVEVYFMQTANDAFGLLSLDWDGEPVNISSQSSNQAIPGVANARAYYGAGLLRIWADTVFARVMAYRETTASRKAVFSLGQSIAANRKLAPEPELFHVLPQTLNPNWQLRQDRLGYFRSHLVLNSLYYLSHQNILKLDHSTEAVTAPYEIKSNDKSSNRVQVLFVKYPTSTRAREALASFHTAYLSEFVKGFDQNRTDNSMNTFSIEDGWLGYALIEACLTVVFECPNQDTAAMFIRNISLRVSDKESTHGK
jgi:hypothetical protein